MQRKKGTAYFRQRPALVSSGDITLSYRRKKLGFESGTKKEGLELDHIYRCCRGKQTNGFKTSPRLLNSVKLASGGVSLEMTSFPTPSPQYSSHPVYHFQ
nr:PREDICTED: death-associated protein-like 1 isoform X4 [Rhinolophus sinicus]